MVLTGLASMTGPRISKIYRNNGSGAFTEIGAGSLTVVRYSSIAFGDIDDDGDLDLILTGNDNTNYPISKIYRNGL